MVKNPLVNLAIYAVLLTVGQTMFKLAAGGGESSQTDMLRYTLSLARNPIFLAACTLYAGTTVLWVSLLRRYPLSQAYPIVIAFSILLTTLISLVLFKEAMNPSKLLGLSLITAGVWTLSQSMQ